MVGHKNYLCKFMYEVFGHFNTNKEYNKKFTFSSFVGHSPFISLERAWSSGFDGGSFVNMLYVLCFSSCCGYLTNCVLESTDITLSTVMSIKIIFHLYLKFIINPTNIFGYIKNLILLGRIFLMK